MQKKLNERAQARQPIKAKTRERFDGVLDEAEKLLQEHGFHGFSVPALAERLGYTRASIYHFFPTPHAILNELSRRYYTESAEQVMQVARAAKSLPWQDLLAVVMQFGADYYNARPVARMLLLGRLMTDENFNVQEQTNQQLGELFRVVLREHGMELPEEPDAGWIMVDIIDSILRHSQYRYDRITDECVAEAIHAAKSYISRFAKA